MGVLARYFARWRDLGSASWPARCRNPFRISRPAVLSMFLLLFAGACSGPGTSPEPSQLEDMVDSGSWYVRVQWPHDGNPHESEHFVVYSDSASLEARTTVADLGERLWAEIVTEMGIEPDEMLRLPPGQDRIDIFAFKDHSPEWAGKAYYGGLAIFSPDHEGRTASGQTRPERYRAILKHELVHVIAESLLHGGGLTEPPWVHVWFFEGFAEALSGGTGGGVIRGTDHLDYLTSKYGQLNPVSYRYDEGVEGGPDAYAEYHYPMRQLAVEYLFDQIGLGRSPRDATALLTDMAAGSDFETAFGDHMGIALSDYEDQFFELMGGYLPDRSRAIFFAPPGLLVVAVVTVGFVSVASIRSVRRSLPGSTEDERAGDSSATGLGVGFVLWITAVATLGLGWYLLGLYSIGSSWALTDGDRTVGLAVMFGYLMISATALIRAMWFRRDRRWLAWVLPLIPIGAAMLSVVAINALI